MDDGLCWTRVVKELEQDYDVIMTLIKVLPMFFGKMLAKK